MGFIELSKHIFELEKYAKPVRLPINPMMEEGKLLEYLLTYCFFLITHQNIFWMVIIHDTIWMYTTNKNIKLTYKIGQMNIVIRRLIMIKVIQRRNTMIQARKSLNWHFNCSFSKFRKYIGYSNINCFMSPQCNKESFFI